MTQANGLLQAKEMCAVDVVSFTRVSKVKPHEGEYDRKIIVKTWLCQPKTYVLRVAKKLRDMEDWKGVYINPSLTLQERKKTMSLERK